MASIHFGVFLIYVALLDIFWLNLRVFHLFDTLFCRIRFQLLVISLPLLFDRLFRWPVRRSPTFFLTDAAVDGVIYKYQIKITNTLLKTTVVFFEFQPHNKSVFRIKRTPAIMHTFTYTREEKLWYDSHCQHMRVFNAFERQCSCFFAHLIFISCFFTAFSEYDDLSIEINFKCISFTLISIDRITWLWSPIGCAGTRH